MLFDPPITNYQSLPLTRTTGRKPRTTNHVPRPPGLPTVSHSDTLTHDQELSAQGRRKVFQDREQGRDSTCTFGEVGQTTGASQSGHETGRNEYPGMASSSIEPRSRGSLVSMGERKLALDLCF